MKIKIISSITLFLIAALTFTACGPSPEQIATMTASAWTPTPVPTNTPVPTPTPTPVPYDLVVMISDSANAAIPGAGIVFPESGSEEPVMADASGKYSWMNLPGDTATLKITAQGYLSYEQSLVLERGLTELPIVLERDPFGLLPSTACLPGEAVLFLEDFQDGKTVLTTHQKEFSPVGDAPGEPGNIVLDHDFTTPLEDFSTYLGQIDGKPVMYGDAVWRMRFFITEESNWGLNWNTAGPNELGDITTSQSSYTISFTTGRRINVGRQIFDANVERYWDYGKPDLADNVLILEPGVWHYLEIATYQGQVQVWLDGQGIVDVIDEYPLPAGAFSIGGASGGIQYFDAISVCGLSAPFTSMTIPVPVP